MGFVWRSWFFKAPGISLNRSVFPYSSSNTPPPRSIFLFIPVSLSFSPPSCLYDSFSRHNTIGEYLIIYLPSLSWGILSQGRSMVGQRLPSFTGVWYLNCQPHFFKMILDVMRLPRYISITSPPSLLLISALLCITPSPSLLHGYITTLSPTPTQIISVISSTLPCNELASRPGRTPTVPGKGSRSSTTTLSRMKQLLKVSDGELSL